MTQIRSLAAYQDEAGNQIISEEPLGDGISINFLGRNNTVMVPAHARVAKLVVTFDGDNGRLALGNNRSVGPIKAVIRIGEDSEVRFGTNVSTTDQCVISAVEGTKVVFGDDVMIASDNEFRADDGHPIFDIYSEKRVNTSRDIIIGNHVWFARKSCALGGATVGSGSVIGFASVVTGKVPNNAVAVGSPARVVRRNIAWERIHLSMRQPPYKPDASTIVKTEEYWNPTDEPARVISPTDRIKLNIRHIRRRAWHVRHRLLNK